MGDREKISLRLIRRGDEYYTTIDTVESFFVVDPYGNTISTDVVGNTKLLFMRTFPEYVEFKILSGDYEGKRLLIPPKFVNNTYLKFP